MHESRQQISQAPCDELMNWFTSKEKISFRDVCLKNPLKDETIKTWAAEHKCEE